MVSVTRAGQKSAEVSGPRAAHERPGAPRRTKSWICFPSGLCILKHERGASSPGTKASSCAGRVSQRTTLALMRLSGSPLRLLCSLLLVRLSAAPDHPGVCPNHLNLNLWVDAQSTCERQCQTDQVNTSLSDSSFNSREHKTALPLSSLAPNEASLCHDAFHFHPLYLIYWCMNI